MADDRRRAHVSVAHAKYNHTFFVLDFRQSFGSSSKNDPTFWRNSSLPGHVLAEPALEFLHKQVCGGKTRIHEVDSFAFEACRAWRERYSVMDGGCPVGSAP